MKVRIDPSQCLNSGLCEEVGPAIFGTGGDDLAHAGRNGRLRQDPGGERCQAAVPEDLRDDAEPVARECPAQCVHTDG